MKLNMLFIFILLTICSQTHASIFNHEIESRSIKIDFVGDSLLKLSHNIRDICTKREMSKQNKKYICEYNQPENIFVNLENKNSKSLLIDIYQVNGANPEVINIISIDVDSDEKTELFVQVMMKFRHSGEGISSYDDIKLYSYDNGIERQRSTGFDFKRLYYIEEEYAKLIANGLADQYDTLNKEVIIKLLRVVKDTNYSSNSLNKEGELWYRKKTEDGYIVAASYFEAALKKNPNYLPALSNLGIAYQKTGEYEKAIQAASKALELTTKPNQMASSHYNIAKAYEHKKDWPLALKHYEKANSYRKHKAYSKGIKRMKEKITTSN